MISCYLWNRASLANNDACHLLGIYGVPSAIRNLLHRLIHLIQLKTLWGRSFLLSAFYTEGNQGSKGLSVFTTQLVSDKVRIRIQATGSGASVVLTRTGRFCPTQDPHALDLAVPAFSYTLATPNGAIIRGRWGREELILEWHVRHRSPRQVL